MAQGDRIYDAAIIGGGPAGLAAAIHLARSRYRVVLFEKDRFGGLIASVPSVVNYPGIISASGEEIADSLRAQASSFGCEFIAAEVSSIDMSGDIKIISSSRGEFKCFSVLLATGAKRSKGDFDGEIAFRGRGVTYCSHCDCEFFTDLDVVVFGRDRFIAGECIFLSRYARKITLVTPLDGSSDGSKEAEELTADPKIEVVAHSRVSRVSGEDFVSEVEIEDLHTGERTILSSNGDPIGVFVFNGTTPVSELAGDLADIDENGYIITDDRLRTKTPCLFAAGDVRSKDIQQLVTAVADGTIAASEMERCASAVQAATGIKTEAPKMRSPETARAKHVADGEIIDASMREQLAPLFERMESPVILEICEDASDNSVELKRYADELASLTEKISVVEGSSCEDHLPCVRILRSDGKWSGLSYHGVPGGHEFTSFVLGIYNASGTGQTIAPETAQRIVALKRPASISMFVTTSCTMCPDLVVAAQKIASMNDDITAEAFDLSLFPDLREKYDVMSVPALLIDGALVGFGRKRVDQLVELLEIREA